MSNSGSVVENIKQGRQIGRGGEEVERERDCVCMIV